MKKSNILNRIFSIILVFALLLSGVNLSFVGEVEAGDGNPENSGQNFTGGGSGTYVTMGHRITLLTNTIIAGNTGTVQSNLNNYLCSKIANSVVITDYTEGGLVCYPSRGDAEVEQKVVSSIGELFPDLSSYNFYVNVSQDGGLMFSLNDSFLNAGGVFDTYIKTHKKNAIESFCACLGVSFPRTMYNSLCFAYEPVLIYRDNGVTAALSFQDVLGNQEGTSFSYAWTKVVHASPHGNPNNYIVRIPGSGATRDMFCALKDTNFSFIDEDGAFGDRGVLYSTEKGKNYAGFGLYGAGDKCDQPAKLASSYTIFLNGDEIKSVKNSTTAVSEDKYGTIHSNITSADIAGNAKEAVLAAHGNQIQDPLNETPVGSDDALKVAMTGIDANAWSNEYEDYELITAGVQSIKLTDVENGTSQDLFTANDKARDKIRRLVEFKYRSEDFNGNEANVALGKKYKLKLSSGSIEEAVSKVANTVANSSGLFQNNSASKIVDADKYDGNRSGIDTNFSLEALDKSNPLDSLASDKYTSKGGKTEGISVTVLTKRNIISSRIAYATIDRSNGNELIYGKNGDTSINQEKKYNINKGGKFKVNGSYNQLCVYVAYPDNKSNNDSGVSLFCDGNHKGKKVFDKVRDYYKSGKCIESADDFKDIAKEAGVHNIEASGTITNAQTIALGADANKNGYNVLILQLKGNVTKHSELTLKDYEINFIYPSMLTTNNYGKLINNSTNAKIGTKTKGKNTCNKVTSHKTSNIGKSKNVLASRNYNGTIINKNIALGSYPDKNILQNDGYTKGIFTTEAQPRTPDGAIFSNNAVPNVRFSLAVNVVRSNFGDKLVVSSITNQQNVTGEYLANNLRMKRGNKPRDNVKKAESTRNSNARVGAELKDTFEWNVKFAPNMTTYQKSVSKDKKDVCKHFNNSCAPQYYKKIVQTKVPASWDGKRVKYIVSEKAYKYQTDKITTAKNNTKTVSDSLRASKNGKGGNKSQIANPYRVAVVKSSGKNLGFYPEVRMRAYVSTGDAITGSNSVKPKILKVMGEKRRTLRPSSMYTIRVQNQGVNKALTSKTISDSTAVGSKANGVSNGLPVIYAGGNVSLNVKSNYTLNMYGYSLDLIEQSDTLEGTGNYSSVVADGSDVKYNSWKNKEGEYNPQSNFNKWIKDTLGKLSADMTLVANGNTYNNFTTSVGKFKEKDKQSKADGVFSIQIKEGKIVDNSGYQALVGQIASDYDCNTDEAKKIFANSGIYQTIIDSIEDCNDSFNTSQKSDAISSERSHWYDEEVKTFVIRRYTKTGVKVPNVLVNDKIDYNSAPTESTSENSSYKTATGKWYFTLYFKDLPSGFTEGTRLYNPKDYGNLNNANSAGTVLLNEVYVQGADFVIPSASTYDMGNK